jgi:proteasome lid subunit RPN8/RPN11
MDILSPKVEIRKTHWQMMLDDINERDKEEACGFVAGVEKSSLEVYPVTNILHSPVRFRMDPEQQLECLIQIEKNQWDLLAIYHSHPPGFDGPSQTDVAEAYYPGVIHLIWSQKDGDWICRGYLINKGQVDEVEVFLIGDEADQNE